MENNMMKTCVKCGETKELSLFYKRKDSPDGFRNDCKDCRKNTTSINYSSNKEEILKKQRGYQKKAYLENPQKFKDKNKRYRRSTKGKQTAKRNRVGNVKIFARETLNNKIAQGVIKKPHTCSVCKWVFSDSSRIHGHHHDYSKPLDVTWVCDSCHMEIHNSFNKKLALIKQ